MKRLLMIAVASIATLATVGRTEAQPAAALGHPLPDGNLAAGTVLVRVVAGSPANPVVGTDVTLVVGDAPRTARTDASGRATFAGLAAGASVQAKIQDADGKEIASDQFPVPSSGGVRVMLTTKPFTGGGGAAPMMGGKGMPEARQMSGQPRPDKETPAGTYAVRITYNNLAMVDGKPKDDKPPVGQTVFLVGYGADDSVIVKSAKADAEGHVVFEELDPTGGTGYFVLAAMPRGAGVDRIFALPTQLDGQMGVRTILSGEKRDAQAPSLDQLATQNAIPTPPNQVRVTLEGFPPPDAVIKVIDAATGQVVASGPAKVMGGDPTTVQGGSKFDAKPDVPANTVDVVVHGGAGVDQPLAGIAIHVIPASATQLDGPSQPTGADGKLRIAVTGTGPQRAVFKVLGRDFVSEPFDVTKSGGVLEINAKWTEGGRPQGLFDIPYKPDQVLYAETTVTGKLEGTYRSMPFQPIAQTGTHVGVIVYPRIMFKFQMRAMVEDQLLAVQGRWTVENNSWAPYRASPDGMMIPLPKGFKGGVIADMNQNDVAVVPNEGLRVIRPLPPGSGVSFVAGFSLAVDNGAIDWKLDLPLGTFGSDLHIRQTPGLNVKLPEGARGGVKPGKDGNSYFMIEQINIPKGRSMTLTIEGLPSPPLWKVWAPRVIGIVVILMILGGVAFAIAARSSVAPDASVRRQALLDELVELERSGRDPVRREQLMAELEKLWGA